MERGILGEGVDRGNCSFLDLGTGNGHFLFRLREGEEEEGSDSDDGEKEESHGKAGDNKGWTGHMLGVDYSPKSIEFAHRLASSKPSCSNIEFAHFDILSSPPSSILTPPNEDGFDVVLDKGTFDAISLSEETDGQGRRVCEHYKERVLPLVRAGGVLLVTSCNWTEGELIHWFEGVDGEGRGFEKVGRVEYRSFRFGGQEGQTVAAVCFRRVGGA